jgi:hypothetical protein
MNPIGSVATTAPLPDQSIEVAEIVNIAFAESGEHVDVSIREHSGKIFGLRIARATIAAALTCLSDKATFLLEMSTSDPVAKLNASIGEWEIAEDFRAATPTLECRSKDGRGVAVAFTYDPITAVPKLQVAVDN